MPYIYKSLKIIETANEIVIKGIKGKDIICEVIPDAVEFVNEYCKFGAILTDLNGVELIIRQNETIASLVEKWKYEHFRITGLEF